VGSRTCGGSAARVVSAPRIPLQLLVLVPAVLALGVPAGGRVDAAVLTVAHAEGPAAVLPSGVPRWMLELPTRAMAAATPSIVAYVAVLPAPLSLPPTTADRLKTVRSVAADSAESAPRSSRAPPAA
jgi:hypothetical protein